MKNPELYHRSINILSKAYLKNTLVHGNSCGCAVGNLIAGAHSYEITPFREWVLPSGELGPRPLWSIFHIVGYITPKELIEGNYSRTVIEEARKQIESTGYSIKETAKIEGAFENTPHLSSDSYDDYMFRSLMSVVECLDEIHENDDENITKEAKRSFVKEEVM